MLHLNGNNETEQYHRGDGKTTHYELSQIHKTIQVRYYVIRLTSQNEVFFVCYKTNYRILF